MASRLIRRRDRQPSATDLDNDGCGWGYVAVLMGFIQQFVGEGIDSSKMESRSISGIGLPHRWSRSFGGADSAVFCLAMMVNDYPVAAVWDKDAEFCKTLLVSFRFFFILVVCWLGSISPYSFELGFGSYVLVGVPLLRRYSWELWVLISVLSGCQHEGGLPLHVVWRYLDKVLKRVNWLCLMLVARLYRYSPDWVSFIVARVFGRKIWLGVGLFWLMDVAFCDGLVTTYLCRNVCRGVGP